jgi:hypothetical protein
MRVNKKLECNESARSQIGRGPINLIAIFLVLLAGMKVGFSQTNLVSSSSAKIRYAAIGDSYSIGEGASEPDSWPTLLARHLTKAAVLNHPCGAGFSVGNRLFIQSGL